MTAPSQTSYQSTAASGSHLNITAKSSDRMPIDATSVTRCRSNSLTCGAAYLPNAASAAVTTSDTIRRKPRSMHLRAWSAVSCYGLAAVARPITQPAYLSVLMYWARSAISARFNESSGLFGCGWSRRKASLFSSNSGVLAKYVNGGA